MDIYFHAEDIELPDIDFETIKKWVGTTIESEDKIGGDINFIFCSNNYLLEINREYLKHDYFTDIITFDYSDEETISGDVFISTETVMQNAKEYNQTFDKELNRICIHGILHLLGYKDKSADEKTTMTQKEDQYLRLFEQNK